MNKVEIASATVLPLVACAALMISYEAHDERDLFLNTILGGTVSDVDLEVCMHAWHDRKRSPMLAA